MKIKRLTSSMLKVVKRFLHKSGKKKLSAEALDIADEVLERAGISRKLLEKDPEYTPWVEETSVHSKHSPAFDPRKHNRFLRKRSGISRDGEQKDVG